MQPDRVYDTKGVKVFDRATGARPYRKHTDCVASRLNFDGQPLPDGRHGRNNNLVVGRSER